MSKLGEELVKRGLVSLQNISATLDIQKSKKADGNISLLGDLLIEQGLIKEEVLDKVIKETNEPIEKGKEWGFILKHLIIGIGSENYKVVKKHQAENDGLHLSAVLDKLKFMTYEAQTRYFVSLMRPFVKNLKIGDIEKVTVSKAGTKQTYIYEGSPVFLYWMPRVEIDTLQVIVSKEEYEKIISAEQEVKSIQQVGTLHSELRFSVEEMVADACAKEASDIHIIPKKKDYYIYFRIEGDLVIQREYTLDIELGRKLVFAFKNLASPFSIGSFSTDDRREVKDGRIELNNICGGVDLRIVVLPDGKLDDEELVARIIRKKTLQKVSLVEQGYFEEDVKVMMRAFRRKGGLFITSGITGSGKTTLNAQLLLHDSERKIETIEDPIEYSLPNTNICQHQINKPKDGPQLGFTELVKGFKRGDPDLMFVGEIRRDLDLILSIIEASHAGQLVMSTLHIRSGFDIYTALNEIFNIDYYTMASLIVYSHNQSLVKCLCNKCKIEDKDKQNANTLKEFKDDFPYIVKDELEDFLSNPPKTYIHNSSGCSFCKETGYKGRTVIYEYFYPDVKFVAWLLKENPNRYEIEMRACSGVQRSGVNKLQIFIKKLKLGLVDASARTIKELM